MDAAFRDPEAVEVLHLLHRHPEREALEDDAGGEDEEGRVARRRHLDDHRPVAVVARRPPLGGERQLGVLLGDDQDVRSADLVGMDLADRDADVALLGRADEEERVVRLVAFHELRVEAQILGQKKADEAIRVFEKNTKDHPESWNAWDSLVDGWATAGDKKKAVANYEKALSLTEDEVQKERIHGEIAKLK